MQHLAKDEIFIERAQASLYRAVLSAESAIVFDERLDAVPGDVLVRRLPGNRLERYQVLDSHFNHKHGNTPAHYRLTIEKVGLKPQLEAARTTNITINNSQGIQVGDHNMQMLADALNELSRRIDATNAPDHEREDVRTKIMALLKHPLVVNVLGGVAGKIVGS